MLVYDDVYHWKGWGKTLNLGSGTCRLQIFDHNPSSSKDLLLLKPVIVIVWDIPGNEMSVKSCAGHIATNVVREFNIKPNRMIWVEYYPAVEYGKETARTIPEKYESVEFSWKGHRAIDPKWRPLKPPLLDEIIRLKNNTTHKF